MAKEFKRYLVTSALPYANGPVHIGHLAGVYIPSDIYTRYLRLKGCDVISVCGSDEHGVPITIKARKEGVTPQQIVDRYHNLIKKSFEGLGMSFDIYSRTSSATHAATASEFSANFTTRGNSSKRPPCSITTRRRRRSLPTVISSVLVPNAGTSVPTATSARNAGLPSRPTS